MRLARWRSRYVIGVLNPAQRRCQLRQRRQQRAPAGRRPLPKAADRQGIGPELGPGRGKIERSDGRGEVRRQQSGEAAGKKIEMRSDDHRVNLAES